MYMPNVGKLRATTENYAFTQHETRSHTYFTDLQNHQKKIVKKTRQTRGFFWERRSNP